MEICNHVGYSNYYRGKRMISKDTQITKIYKTAFTKYLFHKGHIRLGIKRWKRKAKPLRTFVWWSRLRLRNLASTWAWPWVEKNQELSIDNWTTVQVWYIPGCYKWTLKKAIIETFEGLSDKPGSATFVQLSKPSQSSESELMVRAFPNSEETSMHVGKNALQHINLGSPCL